MTVERSSGLGRLFCVAVPMYDEEGGAERCVREICRVVRATDPPGGLLIVDDGSADKTAAILEGLRKDHPEMIVERHERNRGYGAAIRSLIRTAHREGFEYALFMDADLTTDPKYIPDFLAKMREGVDVIKATRYSRGGGMSGVPPHRVLISRAGNLLARLLFRAPITDCTNGFRAVKTSLLARLPLTEDAFAVIMEELYYATSLARTYAEVPYVLTSRGPDQGVSRFVYRPKVFFQYLKYVLLNLFGRPRVPDKPVWEEP